MLSQPIALSPTPSDDTEVVEIKDSDDQSKMLGKVTAVTFSVLISTAEKRLFKLREKLGRYAHIEDDELLSSVLSSSSIQLGLDA